MKQTMEFKPARGDEDLAYAADGLWQCFMTMEYTAQKD